MSSGTPIHIAPASPEEEDRDFAHAGHLFNTVMFPMVLQEAVHMNLFEIIAKYDHQGHGLTSKEIAAKLNTSNPKAPAMLDRMLYMLTCHEVLKCSVADSIRFYSLAPVAKCFVKNEMGVSLGSRLATHKLFLEGCFHLKESVLEGGTPFDRAHGMPLFEYMGKDQKFLQDFNEAMGNHTSIFMSKFLKGYKGLEQINRLVDVAGGLGACLSKITSKYPHIKGINFDLPHVIAHAPSYPGVEHIGGDMFECVPSGDAIFMKWILHDWSDEDCIKLLRNCYKALPDNGKIIVVEANVPEMPDTSHNAKSASLFDMVMMIIGGKERTTNEFLTLAKEAGFSGIRPACVFSYFGVMEFYKASILKLCMITQRDHMPHLIQWILHDWSDADGIKLLRNCYKALPDNGKVIVFEANVPEMPDGSQAARSTSMYDMITLLIGGKERSANEFLTLAKDQAFQALTIQAFQQLLGYGILQVNMKVY